MSTIKPAPYPDFDDSALCRQTDPDAFFPEKGGPTREAKATCLGCDFLRPCGAYALTHTERFGVWGGMSERDRRRLQKEYGITPIPIPTSFEFLGASHRGVDDEGDYEQESA